MKAKSFVLILFISLIAVSCAPKKILFTQYMRSKVEADGLSIKDVQFYNSQEIILQRNVSYEETKIASGAINFENGKYVEIITIEKETPGVCVEESANYLDISFEEGKNKKLRFVKTGSSEYRISAESWKDRFGKVTYDTLTYYIRPGGEKAVLQVEQEDIFKFDQQERKVSGIQVKTSSESKSSTGSDKYETIGE